MDEFAFEELDHSADYAVRISGKDLADLFVHAGQAMFALMQLPPANATGGSRLVTINAHDLEELLVRWLDELLFALEIDGVRLEPKSMEIENGASLQAEVDILPVGLPGKEIKAVTYHGLAICKKEDGLTATVVFDV